MKRSISGSMLIMATLAFAVPAIAHAQNTAPISRAQVNEGLAALERAGFDPAHSQDPD